MTNGSNSELVWLLDGMLFSTQARLKTNRRSPSFAAVFLRGVPTWTITLCLCLVGGLLLHFKTAGWQWLDHWPLVLREVVPAFGEALIIAGLLAVAVDPFLKGKLLEDASKSIFEHMIGFDHEPELKAKLRSIAFDTKLYQRDYDLQCEVQPREGGGVTISACKTIEVVNQSLDDVKFRPGWVFAEPDRASECRVTSFIDGEAPAVSTPQFQPNPHGYSEALSDSIKIEPSYKGKRYRFRAECTFEAPDNYYHPMYFELPTIGITVSLSAPAGWTVWIGRETDHSEFHDKGLYMNGDKIEIQWRKPTE